MKSYFKIPKKLQTNSLIFILIGVVAFVAGAIKYLNGDVHDQSYFWSVLLHNSIYFLLISLASAFILAVVSMAQGAWITVFRRIPEAIAANIWKFGLIALMIMFTIVLSNNTHIYHWLDPKVHEEFTPLKKFFLSKPFFIIWSLVVVSLWSFFGYTFRKDSVAQDTTGTQKEIVKNYWKNISKSAAFVFVFALSLASTIPWLWIMSIDTHWFSTMFSWYNFASSFVAGMSLIMLWVLYVKRKGYLEDATKEHIHDIGKFMFAFSIFWTYLWFSQFMLIWYANIPEETTYFKIRMQGPYKFFFFFNLIVNFVMPILILMSRPSKRNYFTVSFMAVVLLLGHWVDYFQMIMPHIMGEHWTLGWFEFGIAFGFVGLLISFVSNTLASAKIQPQQNPMMKESLIHIS